jgi:tetratricopeptide (TPR) repeat protein
VERGSVRVDVKRAPIEALRLLAVAAAVVIVQAGPVAASDPPSRAKAIEKARALEGDGLQKEARAYLQELSESERSFSQDPTILLELGRLGGTVKESLEPVDLVIEAGRDPEVLAGAHLLKGDYLFMAGRYVAASEEYELAARHAARVSPAANAAALLKRGASLLAAGDASAALSLYENVSRRTDVPADLVAWAELGAGRALMLQGRSSEAAARFDGTLDLYQNHPARPQVLKAAAESHRAAGTEAEALELLRTLADEHPESHEAIATREWLRVLAAAVTAAGGTTDGGSPSEQ